MSIFNNLREAKEKILQLVHALLVIIQLLSTIRRRLWVANFKYINKKEEKKLFFFSLYPRISRKWYLNLQVDKLIHVSNCKCFFLLTNKSVLFAFAKVPVESRIIKHTRRRLVYNGNGTFLDTWQTLQMTFYHYSKIL